MHLEAPQLCSCRVLSTIQLRGLIELCVARCAFQDVGGGPHLGQLQLAGGRPACCEAKKTQGLPPHLGRTSCSRGRGSDTCWSPCCPCCLMPTAAAPRRPAGGRGPAGTQHEGKQTTRGRFLYDNSETNVSPQGHVEPGQAQPPTQKQCTNPTNSSRFSHGPAPAALPGPTSTLHVRCSLLAGRGVRPAQQRCRPHLLQAGGQRLLWQIKLRIIVCSQG